MQKKMSFYNARGATQTSPHKVISICDVTLRDGEQTAGVSFSTSEKQHIAALLDNIGVQQIQLMSPYSGGRMAQKDAEAIIKMHLKADIEVMSHAAGLHWHDSIKAAIDTGADVVHSLLPFSPKMRGMFRPILTDDEIVERAHDAVTFAKEQGAKCINISLLDATRTDEDLTIKTVKALIEAGVDRIRFADTVGTANPDGITYLTKLYKNTINKYSINKKPLLGFHCHNDFGLATANVLAAVQAGVDMVDTTVNGLGERSGNPDIAQVAVDLDVFTNKRTTINMTKLTELSNEVAKISGIPIPSNHPLTGRLVFADESEAHVLATSTDPFAYQGILPESIGNVHHIIMGKKSGINSIAIKLKSLGLPDLSENTRKEFLEDIRNEGAKRRGSVISDSDFIKIAKKYFSYF